MQNSLLHLCLALSQETLPPAVKIRGLSFCQRNFLGEVTLHVSRAQIESWRSYFIQGQVIELVMAVTYPVDLHEGILVLFFVARSNGGGVVRFRTFDCCAPGLL